MERSDNELLTASRAGDRDAFGIFYARHREMLLGYLARRVREPEVAADLMAETFAAALVAVRDGRRTLPDTPVAWVFVIARNLLVDSARRGRVETAARRRLGLEPLVLHDQDLERIGDIAGSSDSVTELAAAIPATEWDAFRAHVLDDQSYSEIAAELCCSEAVVRKRVSRAKSHLRAVLGGSSV
jgi:RNA polymerase sigma-70 factor (ECF subfamily)